MSLDKKLKSDMMDLMDDGDEEQLVPKSRTKVSKTAEGGKTSGKNEKVVHDVKKKPSTKVPGASIEGLARLPKYAPGCQEDLAQTNGVIRYNLPVFPLKSQELVLPVVEGIPADGYVELYPAPAILPAAVGTGSRFDSMWQAKFKELTPKTGAADHDIHHPKPVNGLVSFYVPFSLDNPSNWRNAPVIAMGKSANKDNPNMIELRKLAVTLRDRAFNRMCRPETQLVLIALANKYGNDTPYAEFVKNAEMLIRDVSLSYTNVDGTKERIFYKVPLCSSDFIGTFSDENREKEENRKKAAAAAKRKSKDPAYNAKIDTNADSSADEAVPANIRPSPHSSGTKLVITLTPELAARTLTNPTRRGEASPLPGHFGVDKFYSPVGMMNSSSTEMEVEEKPAPKKTKAAPVAEVEDAEMAEEEEESEDDEDEAKEMEEAEEAKEPESESEEEEEVIAPPPKKAKPVAPPAKAEPKPVKPAAPPAKAAAKPVAKPVAKAVAKPDEIVFDPESPIFYELIEHLDTVDSDGKEFIKTRNMLVEIQAVFEKTAKPEKQVGPVAKFINELGKGVVTFYAKMDKTSKSAAKRSVPPLKVVMLLAQVFALILKKKSETPEFVMKDVVEFVEKKPKLTEEEKVELMLAGQIVDDSEDEEDEAEPVVTKKRVKAQIVPVKQHLELIQALKEVWEFASSTTGANLKKMVEGFAPVFEAPGSFFSGLAQTAENSHIADTLVAMVVNGQ